MGMTIDEEVRQIKEQLADVSNKYRAVQADYNARLKADLVAILTDFDNQIEPNSTRIDCESIIEQKIQALEGKTDGEK